MSVGLSALYDDALMRFSLGITSSLTATPTGNYISLHGSAIGTAKVIASTEWNQTAPSNYARLNMSGTIATGANWTIAGFDTTNGIVATNAGVWAFPALTGSSNTAIFAVGLFGSLSGTTTNTGLLWFADLPSSQAVGGGIIVQFNIGDISLKLN